MLTLNPETYVECKKFPLPELTTFLKEDQIYANFGLFKLAISIKPVYNEWTTPLNIFT